MVAETEKEFASLPDERVALRWGFRSSGPDSPQISVSGGLPVDLYHGFDRGLALQATLEVEPADKCLSLIFRIVLVISPALIERFDSEEASNLLARKTHLFELSNVCYSWQRLSEFHSHPPVSLSRQRTGCT